MASSSSSQYGGNGSGGRRGRGRGRGRGTGRGRGRGRGGDFEGPSSSRRRSGDGVWPEPFVEALAVQVAIDASRSVNRLAAAAALFNLFQVCSRWQAVSRSDLLWRELTRRIWNRRLRLLPHPTWRDEFIFRHRTARNFRTGRYIYTALPLIPPDDDGNDGDGDEDNILSCRRLALSDHHLAAGFSDGSVRLFHLPSRTHLLTLRPQHRHLLGRFSRAVSGIILSDAQVIFASHDGDIHVAMVNNGAPVRRAHLGAVVNDGALVDFSGCSRWWVGLYAGVPGRAFHVWNGLTEELVFVGGTLTDPEAVTGWHLLTDLTDFIARVRVPTHDSAVACTSLRVIVLDLTNHGIILGDEEFHRGLIVGSVDASESAFVAVDARGLASVRRVATLEEICQFTVRGATQRAVLGCMNSGYVIMCTGGVFRVWEVEHGAHLPHLYSFRERVGEVTAVAADERYVVACSSDTSMHLWDFGAQ
ncbi:hypothetical protein RHGRI_009690 [Rhododendron griersonianum]|uniref:Transcriptional regulator STERILE APETALA n=1 Tax=Rhododendron griersonianum TaxID=479676 RepID=A0AAV6KGF7_9ERIC|nr:hypothetical protein RHGRI_009690 [Rhododendron griersonianum]